MEDISVELINNSFSETGQTVEVDAVQANISLSENPQEINVDIAPQDITVEIDQQPITVNFSELSQTIIDVHVGTTPPPNPYNGKLWLDTNLNYPSAQADTLVSATYTALVSDMHLLCNGTFTVTLPLSADRDWPLKITNVGTGQVTIVGTSGETINDDASKILAFQWTTVDLAPVTGGYVI